MRGKTERQERWTDEQIREELRIVDQGDADVGSWVAEFLENVLYRYKGPLTDRQRRKALQIIEDYVDA